MQSVEPIRDLNKIKAMKNELLKSSFRDYVLFLCGINLGRRINDLLNLKVQDLKGKSHLMIKENKTDKIIPLAINQELQTVIMNYSINMNKDDYLFKSRNGKNKPISRVQAYRILNNAAQKCNISMIGTHSMRKTFGYHFYRQTKDVATLMKLFGHSTPSITLEYIGLCQEDYDESMKKFVL